MANTTTVYGQAQLKICTGSIDLDTDTFKAMLVTDSNAPDIDADDFRDDRTTGEVANGNGYTTGGVTLSGVAVTYDSASHQVRFDCSDFSWTFSASTSFRYIDYYKSRGGASSADEVFAVTAFDSNQTVSGAYTFQVPAAGLLFWDVQT